MVIMSTRKYLSGRERDDAVDAYHEHLAQHLYKKFRLEPELLEKDSELVKRIADAIDKSALPVLI
jgi:hypothetical protein